MCAAASWCGERWHSTTRSRISCRRRPCGARRCHLAPAPPPASSIKVRMRFQVNHHLVKSPLLLSSDFGLSPPSEWLCFVVPNPAGAQHDYNQDGIWVCPANEQCLLTGRDLVLCFEPLRICCVRYLQVEHHNMQHCRRRRHPQCQLPPSTHHGPPRTNMPTVTILPGSGWLCGR